VWCYLLQANYSTHLQLMVEILNKVSGSQGKGEEKFSVAKVTLGSEPGMIRIVDGVRDQSFSVCFKLRKRTII
jgi:hypothetical protein